MNRYSRFFICFVTMCLLCSPLFFNVGCAGSKANKFTTKIQTMSDNDLLNYYHGIDDRIRDIESDIEQKESSAQIDQDRTIANAPFIVGGEGYSLMQKKKLLLEELKNRSLTP